MAKKCFSLLWKQKRSIGECLCGFCSRVNCWNLRDGSAWERVRHKTNWTIRIIAWGMVLPSKLVWYKTAGIVFDYVPEISYFYQKATHPVTFRVSHYQLRHQHLHRHIFSSFFIFKYHHHSHKPKKRREKFRSLNFQFLTYTWIGWRSIRT